MASLTLKNIPEPLMYRLRTVAERKNRSLNRQVIEILQNATTPRKRDVQATLERVREVRKLFRRPVTLEEILAGREEGRK